MPLERPERSPAGRVVVFVCEHGSGKSVIAAEWFNRLARKRGLDLRAVSRGMSPDLAVPPAIADRLWHEGFDVTEFEPRPLTEQDAAGVLRIVSIGVDTSSVTASSAVPVEVWEGAPPASRSYERAREALIARIEALLESMPSDESGR